ncbi:MAG: hypothetical protein ABSD64_14670 [Terriglobales bacterium]|jgi:hypothetical protein
MRRRADVAIQIVALLVLWVSPWPMFAQTPKPPSLQEQMEAQYPPATVLAVQKQGVLGVAPASKMCAATYQDGKLKPAEVSCTAPLKDSSRLLTLGEKVHPSEIKVDLAQEQIWLWIVECDSCNKGITSSSYKAQIEFQFAKAYLEKGNVPEIVDTISQVLSFVENADQQVQPTEGSNEVLTNNDVVDMAKAKVADGSIIRLIKGSDCNFDTSAHGLANLAREGVSDPVIQAMQDAREAKNAGGNEPAPPPVPGTQQPTAPTPVPGQLSFSVSHRHYVFVLGGPDTEYYCPGTLSVLLDGTVGFDCAQAGDPSGHGEHLSFAPGSWKEVKIGQNGNLHLASKKGKFDFYGDSNVIEQAKTAIAPQVQK